MGTQNGREYQKSLYRFGAFVKLSMLLFSPLTGTCPRKWRITPQHSSALVYVGCLLLGKDPESPFGKDAYDPVPLAEQLVLANLCLSGKKGIPKRKGRGWGNPGHQQGELCSVPRGSESVMGGDLFNLTAGQGERPQGHKGKRR